MWRRERRAKAEEAQIGWTLATLCLPSFLPGLIARLSLVSTLSTFSALTKLFMMAAKLNEQICVQFTASKHNTENPEFSPPEFSCLITINIYYYKQIIFDDISYYY